MSAKDPKARRKQSRSAGACTTAPARYHLWDVALLSASKGDRFLLSDLLRLSGESHAAYGFMKADGTLPKNVQVPRAVAEAIADVLEGKTEWPMRKRTRGQQYEHLARHLYKTLRDGGTSTILARRQVADMLSLSFEVVTDIVYERKTFGKNRKKFPMTK